jgi:hypothetical protein
MCLAELAQSRWHDDRRPAPDGLVVTSLVQCRLPLTVYTQALVTLACLAPRAPVAEGSGPVGHGHDRILPCLSPSGASHPSADDARRHHGVVAQTTRILLTDDLDGSEAAETVTFAVDGVTYEIDLSGEHATQLRESVALYVDNGRKLSGRRAPVGKRAASKTASGKPAEDRPDTQQVREWAKEHGIEVSERGRLSNDLIVRFQEANS